MGQPGLTLALARACESLGCQIELKAKCMHFISHKLIDMHTA